VHYFDNKFYKSLDWYARFFGPVGNDTGRTKTFEASPGYLYHPAVPKRVKQSLPSVKLVAVLRDPVERAVSQYRWIRQIGLEARDAVTAFQYDAERIGWERDPDYLQRFDDPLYFDFDHIHRGYLRRSLYDEQLRRWLDYFGPAQIRVVSSPLLFNQTDQVLSKLIDFLGVERVSNEEQESESINQNSSRDDVTVPEKARRIAKQHLTGVAERTESVLADRMVVGERPLLTE
jgi:hypothetical protein